MKKIVLAWIGFSVLLLGACTSEKVLWENGDGTSPIPANTLRLRVDMEGMVSEGALTRADVPAEESEDEIESLFLLFFESKTDNSGQFVDYLEIENPAGSGSTHDINMTGTQLKVTDPYHILAIANIHGDFGKYYLNNMSVDAWMLQWVGKKESEVIAEANAWTRSGMKVMPKQLLMNARVEKQENQFEVKIRLIRNQVRFDILNSLKEDYGVVSVEVRNAYVSSKIWNDGTSNGALDFSDNVNRIPEYYKFVNATDNPKYKDNPYADDIYGGLYAFENQVTMPERNDAYTTCLIVELKKHSASTSTFYRINIAPDASAQMLKRNNAYRVTLNNVGGEGHSTADGAFNNPNDNQLDYTINIWDQEGVGVIVQDANSMISSPYKTVMLPRATITGSNPVIENSVSASFQIFTFTKNPNPVSPLEILEQTYSYNNSEEEYFPKVTASLDGNVLTVKADPIPSGATVKGVIKLGYAGLRATINVLQTDLVDDFLQVHLPDGGIPRFAPFGDISSGLLRVEASDTWTAELFAKEGGFTFKKGMGKTRLSSDPSSPDYDASVIVDGNKFRLWTLSPNTLQTMRQAFVVVSLDKDSENFVQVIPIAQDVAADIAITPQHTVTFDGTGALALIPNNTDQQFVVRPSQTGDPATFETWEYVLEGPNASAFTVTEGHTQDVNNPNGNFVKVAANGKNTSGTRYTAKLTVRLTARHAVATSIDLVQTSSGIDFSPNSVPATPKVGGETELITVQADPSLQWELLGFKVVNTSSSKNPVNHTVKLVKENGDPIAVGDRLSVADKFKVVFPKIYYPNRDIPISATVEVGIVGSTLKKSITVNQTPLTAAAFQVAAPQTGGYGNLHGGSYNTYFRRGIRAMGSVSASVSANSTMYYRTPYGLYPTYNWGSENSFIGSRDALMMIVSDEHTSNFIGGLNAANSPLRKAGLSISQAYGLDARINTGVNNTKIYKLLIGGAASGVPAIGTGYNFYEDGISTQVTNYPSTTVPIIAHAGTNRAFLAIDPKHRLIYLGESQLFDTTDGNAFLNNLLVYIKNAAIYGSHFTDLLIEEADGGQPAPWDSAWGANAGIDR